MQHHSFAINHPIAVEHAHVVESIVANLFPMFLPCVVLKVHGTTFMLWFSAMLAEGSDAHSGFALPYSPFRLFRQSERHAFHHSHCGGAEGLGTSGCYGGWLHFWDWCCGTDASFLDLASVTSGVRTGVLVAAVSVTVRLRALAQTARELESLSFRSMSSMTMSMLRFMNSAFCLDASLSLT